MFYYVFDNVTDEYLKDENGLKLAISEETMAIAQGLPLPHKYERIKDGKDKTDELQTYRAGVNPLD